MGSLPVKNMIKARDQLQYIIAWDQNKHNHGSIRTQELRDENPYYNSQKPTKNKGHTSPQSTAACNSKS